VRVHVRPRANADAIVGFDEAGRLCVRVTAAPAEGKANDAVVRVIARALGVARQRVTIESGARSRTKTVAVAEMTAEELVATIGCGRY